MEAVLSLDCSKATVPTNGNFNVDRNLFKAQDGIVLGDRG